ncbi:hypothetical protein [Paenibacillus eucommiae]|uniref:Uncharacterized protein n=1 Tax=Paenibacillus eucommiae TaxID=1355755 RepID=A0ABS4J2M5_9BACL|nr:hypothetical protein [Paenibacillus eucommiae]MBP1994077.1 hypothetical protein [Paenibacillus eucommiae]
MSKHYGVVILRFDSGDYQYVSSSHAGYVPSECIALLQTGINGQAAEIINYLTEHKFKIKAFNPIGIDDLIYTLVRES